MTLVTWYLLPDFCFLVLILQPLLFDKYYPRLFIKYMLPATCYLIHVNWYLLPDTCYLILSTTLMLADTCFLIFISKYLLSDEYYWILVTEYLLYYTAYLILVTLHLLTCIYGSVSSSIDPVFVKNQKHSNSNNFLSNSNKT